MNELAYLTFSSAEHQLTSYFSEQDRPCLEKEVGHNQVSSLGKSLQQTLLSFYHHQNTYHFFLCLFAKFLADSTLLNPQALNAKAFRVGLPFSSFIGPFMPANRAANETLRPIFFEPALGLLFTGGFKLAPSLRLK